MSARSEGTIECTDDGGCPQGYHCDPESGICVDDYGEPASRPHDVVGSDAGDPVPVRYLPQGPGIQSSLIRTAVGEDVMRSPMVVADADLSATLAAGDTLSLEPIVGSYDAYDDLEAQAVNEVYGARRARPQRTTIELEQN